MLTTLLIRHATCDHLGRSIAGRAPGVHLNAVGRDEARTLAGWLSRIQMKASAPVRALQAVYSGPLERATETAEILARELGLPIQIEPGLNELDFGAWTGLSLTELDADPVWHAFNSAREHTRIPGGELMSQAIDRATAALSRIELAHPEGMIAVVSHGDIIRGLVLRALRMSLNEVHRIEVAPASVSAVEMSNGEPCRALSVNWRPGGPIG
ncbi:MAG TPA: histidine phosphatase family protein [Gemmatimonadales bacterium]|nr:histidine phosphatase family protein [Gemmatimonadales bacterium]